MFLLLSLIFLFQNIAINHSADIDCQDVMKIYRECTKEPYNFLTIDTSLPASDPLKFRKKLLILTYKNDNNWSDYNFRQKNCAKWSTIQFRQKKAAIISAQSSKNLDKVEYLTGKDLGLKPDTTEQARFEYSPLGKVFNKGLSEDDKKEGLFKRLKTIEGKNEKLLEVKNKTEENIKVVTDFVDHPLSLEAEKLIEQIRAMQKNVDYKKLKIRGGNDAKYDFSDYKTLK